MSDANDRLARSYARLRALKENLSNETTIYEVYVSEYHSILGNLEELGYDLAEFAIPDAALHRRILTKNVITGQVTYGNERYVDRPLFMAKLDAVLTYFSLSRSAEPQKPRIGFTPHN